MQRSSISSRGSTASEELLLCSGDEDTSSTGLLDSLLGGLGEELGLDDDGDLGEDSLSEDLEVALKRG